MRKKSIERAMKAHHYCMVGLQSSGIVNTNPTTNLNFDNLLLVVAKYLHKLHYAFLARIHQCYFHNMKLSSWTFPPPLATWCDMCWACAPKPRCHGSYMMAFSCYKTCSSSKGPVGFYLCLAYFEALDPPSCLPFGAHCVMEGVTERAVSLAVLPPPIHSS